MIDTAVHVLATMAFVVAGAMGVFLLVDGDVRGRIIGGCVLAIMALVAYLYVEV